MEYNNCSNYQEYNHNKFYSLNVNKILLVDKYCEIKTISNHSHTNAQSPNPTNNTNQIYTMMFINQIIIHLQIIRMLKLDKINKKLEY